jgi:hypothetical protein
MIPTISIPNQASWDFHIDEACGMGEHQFWSYKCIISRLSLTPSFHLQVFDYSLTGPDIILRL